MSSHYQNMIPYQKLILKKELVHNLLHFFSMIANFLLAKMAFMVFLQG